MTTSGYVELLVEELLEERYGPRPRRIWQESTPTTSEQQRRRRVLLGLEEEQNGTR